MSLSRSRRLQFEALESRLAATVVYNTTCLGPLLSIPAPGSSSRGPAAMDDSFIIERGEVGAGSALLAVLSNDRTEPGDPLVVNYIECQQRYAGQASISYGRVAIDYKPPAQFVGIDQFRYAVEDREGFGSSATITVEVRNGWRNQVLPGDVNGDRIVSPLDALVVLNELNARGSRQLGRPGPEAAADRLDVDGNGYVNPLDALLVINELNAAAHVPAPGQPSG